MTTFIVLNWESAESKDNLHVDYMKWNKYSPFTSIVFYSGLLNSCFCSEPLFPVLQHQWDVSLSSSLLSAETSEATQEPVSVPSSSSVDLSELLLEIRHLRLQLERSIQTNTALRQRLEEQLLRGPNRSETININYLLSSPGKHKAQTRTLMTSDRYMEACKHTHRNLPGHANVCFPFPLDEGGRSPGREGCDPPRHSFQSHHEHTSVLHGKKTLSEVARCLIIAVNASPFQNTWTCFNVFRETSCSCRRGRRVSQ